MEGDSALRPRTLDDYVGQKRLKEKFRIYLEAARGRGEPLDHVLLYGPPGLGKTTLSHIIANELGVGIRVTSGPAIEKPGDLAAILTNALDEGDVLFIDEIHRLGRVAEEHLYPAMEDFKIDIILGQGPAARTIRLDLPRFTLIGATTRPGLITGPMRSRFGIIEHLEYYTDEELAGGVTRDAKLLGFGLEPDAALEIGRRARGTMRIAKRLVAPRARLRGGRGRGDGDFGAGQARAQRTRHRRTRVGRARPDHPRGHDLQIRGRPGGRGHARHLRERGRRYFGRSLRALPHPARLYQKDAARARRHGARVSSPGLRLSGETRRRGFLRTT